MESEKPLIDLEAFSKSVLYYCPVCGWSKKWPAVYYCKPTHTCWVGGKVWSWLGVIPLGLPDDQKENPGSS